MANDWYVRVMGEVIGPMGPADVQDMVDAKHLGELDDIRRGTSGDWKPANSVKGLRFGPPPLEISPIDDMALSAVSTGVVRSPQTMTQAAESPAEKRTRQLRVAGMLLSCPACRREVSSSAARCVHCGHQLQETGRIFFGVLIKWAFILFNVVMSLWFGFVFIEACIRSNPIAAILAFGFLGGIWAAGSIVLGVLVLLTRPSSR